MSRRLLFVPIAIAVAVIASFVAGQTPVPVVKEPAGEISGALVICGGGSIPDAVRSRFVELAGGKKARLVFIPTASAAADKEAKGIAEPWKKYTVESLDVLHTRDRKEANDSAFVKALGSATGVWLGGGQQTKLMEAYRGTAVEVELKKLLARGGVIGGTSAGAAVMSQVMITGSKPIVQTSTGFGFLTHAVVDQHFLKRNRTDRLVTVLARNPGLFGIGVDEQTAVVVKSRTLTVVGNSYAVICQSASPNRPASFQVLKDGEKADLVALSRAAIERTKPPHPPVKPPMPIVKKGTLIIGGGGGMPDEVWDRFFDAAGGKDSRIVFIPTAGNDPIPAEPGEVKRLKKSGATNVKVVHSRKRTDVESPAFLKELRDAKAVWFGGGRQWKLVDAYLDTAAEREFHSVLERGGVIGGSSAGASIQADYMVRGDPLGNLNIIAEGYERGLGFLKGVAIDQHFFKRKRPIDMTELMAVHPQILGIGIDEQTAIVVRGEVMEVVGKSKVAVYDRTRPLVDGQADFQALTHGTRYDMKSRMVVK